MEDLYNKVSRHHKILVKSKSKTFSHRSSTHRVSSLEHTVHSLGDYLLKDGNWDRQILEDVSQIGPTGQIDGSRSSFGICAVAGGKAWTQNSLEKPVSCPWPPCGKGHSPNICCIFSSTNHKVDKCWHVIDKPSRVKEMIAAFKVMKESGDGPLNQDPIKAKLDAKVCTIVSKEQEDTKPSFDTKPKDAGTTVPSTHEFITDAKEDVKDMDNGEDMSHYISPHMKNFVSAIEFNLDQQVAEINGVPDVGSEDKEEEEEEEQALEQATEVLKEQLELVDSKANNLKPSLRPTLRSDSKKPIPAKEYPKDSKRYDLLPFGYSLPEHGPEPPNRSKKDMDDFAYIHLDTGATVVCTNKEGDLNDCVPTDLSCGTAANDEGSKVTGLGTFGFVCESLKGTKIKFMFTNSLEVPNFKRISLSVHVLRDMDYDTAHFVLSSGSYLWISKVSQKQETTSSTPGLQFLLVDDNEEHSMLFPLVRHKKADFLKIQVVTGSHVKGEKPSCDMQVQAINLAHSLTGANCGS